jgi:hypothetical protein
VSHRVYLHFLNLAFSVIVNVTEKIRLVMYQS